MRRHLAATAWAVAFVAAFTAPALLTLRSGEDSALASQLAVQAGLLATSALVCAVAVPSRLRSLTRALGIDGVLGVHRWIGMLAALLVLAHVVLVLAANPANIALLDVRHAPRPANAGVAATVTLVALVGLAVLRRRVRHHYELWRWVHLALAGSVLVLSALHIWWLGDLVHDPAVRTAFGLQAAVLLAVLGYRWVWRPVFDPRSEYTVRTVRPKSETASTLVLEPRRSRHGAGHPTLTFAPGQFAWLRLRRSTATGEHPFTITSSAHLGLWVEFTIRHAGDFTRTLAGLRSGDSVWLDGPHGGFTVDNVRSTGLVMIAGGVGITPMMSMLRTLAHRADRRQHRLVVAARTHEELMFRDELESLQSALDLRIVEVISRARGAAVPDQLDEALLARVLPGRYRRNKFDYFVCGPPGMVTDVVTALDALDVRTSRIHTEQFDLV